MGKETFYYRDGLAEGTGALEEASTGPVVWFTDRPSARPVLEAAERVARRP
jgi:hypothetical protein